MIVDLLFFYAVVFGMIKLVQKAGVRLRTHWLAVVLGAIVSLFWVSVLLMVNMDSRYLLTNHTAYKTTKRELIFGLQ